MNYVRIACIVVALAGLMVCGLASALVSIELVGEVNKELPADEQFLEAFWYLGKLGRVTHQHARLFPNSNLRVILRVLHLTGAGCWVRLALTIFCR